MDSRAIIEVIDNLESTSATASLSANQGRVLKGLIDAINVEDEVESYTYSNQKEGCILFKNGFMIQHGRVEITPVTANAPVYELVTFDVAYTYAPVVIVQPITNYPAVVHAAVRDGSPTSFKAYIQRDNLNTTGVEWVALGYKNVNASE